MPEPESHMPEGKPAAGMLAAFATPEALLEAAERVRDAGFRSWDVQSPFPVHGMDRAMGIRRTILPWIVLAGGLTGCAVAFLLQWFTNSFDYPYRVSGKPYFSLPALLPVAFELTVLFSAVTAFLGMLILNLLPELHHPVFRVEMFRRVTDDRFFLLIDARDPQFDPERTRALLESLKPAAVELVEAEP